MSTIDEFVVQTIREAVITVPGVVGLANFSANNKKDLSTNDIHKAIEFVIDKNTQHFKIHVILLYGVNILDILKEIQIRIKYELEKNFKNNIEHKVDVIVEDLI
ncbi:Asp23/Gls24 family envelope stress response protein [Mycoplasma mycoides]|uniref:Asp23/Gls24 family envelope stress response protein n=1 Tax=Mycoplasma mycoides TaxID=2102 RepID=UPI00223F35CD|nr:Asp23/Gls24 family envelope stress response protein [Mycoplasma mycoides]QVK06404.1 Asp23/Gls24 family envelope stress response protein [Mycoplasma mycoides subsp. capri]